MVSRCSCVIKTESADVNLNFFMKLFELYPGCPEKDKRRLWGMAHVTLLRDETSRWSTPGRNVMGDNQKLSLQAFLQVLTSKSLPISRAMTVASKMYCISVLSVCISKRLN